MMRREARPFEPTAFLIALEFRVAFLFDLLVAAEDFFVPVFGVFFFLCEEANGFLVSTSCSRSSSKGSSIKEMKSWPSAMLELRLLSTTAESSNTLLFSVLGETRHLALGFFDEAVADRVLGWSSNTVFFRFFEADDAFGPTLAVFNESRAIDPFLLFTVDARLGLILACLDFFGAAELIRQLWISL